VVVDRAEVSMGTSRIGEADWDKLIHSKKVSADV
jgi:hypothetical protein